MNTIMITILFRMQNEKLKQEIESDSEFPGKRRMNAPKNRLRKKILYLAWVNNENKWHSKDKDC